MGVIRKKQQLCILPFLTPIVLLALVIFALISVILFYLFLKIFIYLFGCARSQLQHTGSSLPHAGSLVAACGLLVAAYGIQFPDQGSNPGPLHWERGILTTGPPGKSLVGTSVILKYLAYILFFFFFNIFIGV